MALFSAIVFVASSFFTISLVLWCSFSLITWFFSNSSKNLAIRFCFFTFVSVCYCSLSFLICSAYISISFSISFTFYSRLHLYILITCHNCLANPSSTFLRTPLFSFCSQDHFPMWIHNFSKRLWLISPSNYYGDWRLRKSDDFFFQLIIEFLAYWSNLRFIGVA